MKPPTTTHKKSKQKFSATNNMKKDVRKNGVSFLVVDVNFSKAKRYVFDFTYIFHMCTELKIESFLESYFLH